MERPLTLNQEKVLYYLQKKENYEERLQISEPSKPSAWQIAYVTRINPKSIYRVLESLEKKGMVGWKNHDIENLKLLRKGRNCQVDPKKFAPLLTDLEEDKSFCGVLAVGVALFMLVLGAYLLFFK